MYLVILFLSLFVAASRGMSSDSSATPEDPTGMSSDSSATPEDPTVVFCHATSSYTNPYNKQSKKLSKLKSHKKHTGSPFDPILHSAPGSDWGDIIPVVFSTGGDELYEGLNANVAAAWIARNCDAPTLSPTPRPTPVPTLPPSYCPDVLCPLGNGTTTGCSQTGVCFAGEVFNECRFLSSSGPNCGSLCIDIGQPCSCLDCFCGNELDGSDAQQCELPTTTMPPTTTQATPSPTPPTAEPTPMPTPIPAPTPALCGTCPFNPSTPHFDGFIASDCLPSRSGVCTEGACMIVDGFGIAGTCSSHLTSVNCATAVDGTGCICDDCACIVNPAEESRKRIVTGDRLRRCTPAT